jgi:CDP-diacylglycerol--glycerol-3-phosphate 3-phosphatidyltransferase
LITPPCGPNSTPVCESSAWRHDAAVRVPHPQHHFRFAAGSNSGAIARHFGFTSELGARLDSIADLLLFGVAAYGIRVFHPQVVSNHAGVFLLVVALWLGGSLAGFLRYGRMASFHTFLSRATAYALGGFIAVLFLWGFNSWLFWVGVGLAVAAQIEEFILLALLPVWTPNVGGLYRLLRERAKHS